jgi:glycosyltransferase involved in cell wall biosynthesis
VTASVERRLRIAMMVGYLPREQGGGTERQALRAAVELARRGHRIWILARGPTASREYKDGVWIIQRPELRSSGARHAGNPAVRFVSDLTRGIGDVLSAGERFDVILTYHTFNAGLVGTVASVVTGAPQVVWIRSGQEYRWLLPPHLPIACSRLLASTVWLQAQALLVQSPTLAREFETAVATYFPAAVAVRVKRKLQVLRNGLDVPADVGAPSKGRELLCVGRLHPGKGLEYLIQALPLIPGAHLTVVGDGEERASLERLSGCLPVTFVGPKGVSDMTELYKRTSVVVFPSTLDEGLPNVVLEALAFGRPVVTTRKGGVADVVQEGVNGSLVEAGQSVALAAAINQLLESHDRLVCMGAAARRAVSGYSWDEVIPRLESVLTDSARRRVDEPRRNLTML